MKIVLGAKGSQVNVIYACYIIISVPSIYTGTLLSIYAIMMEVSS